MNKTTSLTYSTRLFVIALVALCVPLTLCEASVEPELTMAIGQKNVPKVERLLANGANVNERDEGAEQTPLMRAVQVQDPALVQVLLAHGATVNTQDDFGKTALMFATDTDNAEIIKLLLRKGADTSLRDAKTMTASDIARKHGHKSTLSLLAQSQQFAMQKAGKSRSHSSNRMVALR